MAHLRDSRGSVRLTLPDHWSSEHKVAWDGDALQVETHVLHRKRTRLTGRTRWSIDGPLDGFIRGGIPIGRVGEANIDVAYQGTWSALDLKWKSSDFFYDKIGLFFGNIAGQAKWDGTKVEVLSLSCDDGQQGRIEGQGSFHVWSQTARLVLHAHNFMPLHNDALRFRIQGTVEMNEKRNIKGQVELDDFRLQPEYWGEERWSQIDLGLPSSKVPWFSDCDIQVRLKKPARVKHSWIESSWNGTGKVVLIDREWRILGTFNACPNGRLLFFGKKLALEKGRVIFNRKKKEPRLDLLFRRSIHNRKIFVHIKGRTDRVVPEIYSTPSDSFENSVSYLLFNNTKKSLSHFQVGMLLWVLTSLSTGEIKASSIGEYIDMRKEKDDTNTLIVRKPFREEASLSAELNDLKSAVVLEKNIDQKLQLRCALGYQKERYNQKSGFYAEPEVGYRVYY